MKIKTKLVLGIGVLFLMVILLAALGAWYINALKNDTENILAANYNTLEFSRNMMLALDQEQPGTTSTIFEQNLARQQLNITEYGEAAATARLALHYGLLKDNPADAAVMAVIRKDISEVMKLNMEAIRRKTDKAKETAANANLWIAVAGTLCFLFALVLLVNLPDNIAGPVKELTASIQSIAMLNYAERLRFKGSSEFEQLARSFNVMAEKLEEYNNSNLSQILMEKKRIEMLINNMADPVIGLDEQGQIIFVNQEALHILGLKADIIGKAAADVSLYNDLMRSLVLSLTAPAGNENVIKIYAHNKERYFERHIVPISITPAAEREGQQIGYVILLQDITPFKELDFAKTNFIATVSHELKTPIASIKMSLQLLNNKNTGQLNEDQQLLIDSISDDGERLLKITGELLNMTQAETGNIQMNMTETPPYKIADYALEAVRFQAAQKSITLEVQVPGHLPLILADQEKTAWVLINFLTNAIRYAPEHSSVATTAEQVQSAVVFSVSDHGPGIEPQYLGKLFDRYFQVPGSQRTGTGLGLAISKEFIEAQGGQIGVESTPGIGSRFYCMLNIASL